MLFKNFQFRLKNIGFALSMVMGLLVISAVSASAQYYPQTNRDQRQQDRRQDKRDNNRDKRDNRRDDDDDNYNNNGRYGNNNYSTLERTARQNGYRDGMNARRNDRNGRRNDPTKDSAYKSGTNGYYKSLGSKGTYKQIYRQAYLQGYNSQNNNKRRNNRNRNGGY